MGAGCGGGAARAPASHREDGDETTMRTSVSPGRTFSTLPWRDGHEEALHHSLPTGPLRGGFGDVAEIGRDLAAVVDLVVEIAADDDPPERRLAEALVEDLAVPVRDLQQQPAPLLAGALERLEQRVELGTRARLADVAEQLRLRPFADAACERRVARDEVLREISEAGTVLIRPPSIAVPRRDSSAHGG